MDKFADLFCAVVHLHLLLAARTMGAKPSSSEKALARINIARQLALFLDNRPGTLARLCEALSDGNIKIYAISTSDTVDHIVVRMVLSDPDRALALFEERGTLVVISEVLMIEGSNKPGGLAAIAQALSKAKINIEYAYCATPPNAQKGLLILRVSDPKKALKILNN